MSERIKALSFVVCQLFSKNCKRCSLETLPISVPSVQYFAQWAGDGQETHKVFLVVKRWTNFRSKVVLLFLEGKLFSLVLIAINKIIYVF